MHRTCSRSSIEVALANGHVRPIRRLDPVIHAPAILCLVIAQGSPRKRQPFQTIYQIPGTADCAYADNLLRWRGCRLKLPWKKALGTSLTRYWAPAEYGQVKVGRNAPGARMFMLETVPRDITRRLVDLEN